MRDQVRVFLRRVAWRFAGAFEVLRRLAAGCLGGNLSAISFNSNGLNGRTI
jgi:hypothetical protein